MVTENEQEILNRIKQQEENKLAGKNKFLTRIEELEKKQEREEEEFRQKQEELLMKITNQSEEVKKARREKIEAQQAAKIAEFKYLNQEKSEIRGVAGLINLEEEKDPERMSKKIFLEQLRAMRIKSEKALEDKKDNVYYL